MTTILSKGNKMAREFRAKFVRGKLEPLEKVDLKEGEEVFVSVREERAGKGGFERAAGGWKGLVDTDALLRDYQESRRIQAPEVRL